MNEYLVLEAKQLWRVRITIAAKVTMVTRKSLVTLVTKGTVAKGTSHYVLYCVKYLA